MADTEWRRELWLAHAGAGFRHNSDRDMHCPACEIDFARDSAQQIGHQLAMVAWRKKMEAFEQAQRYVREWLDHVDRVVLEEDPPGADVHMYDRILRLGQRVRAGEWWDGKSLSRETRNLLAEAFRRWNRARRGLHPTAGYPGPRRGRDA